MAKEKEEKKKEKRPQALKRDIQNEKKRLRNKAFKSQVRSAIRNFESILTKNETQSTAEALNGVYSLMDRGVKKGVFKLNTASRTKARLAARCVKAK